MDATRLFRGAASALVALSVALCCGSCARVGDTQDGPVDVWAVDPALADDLADGTGSPEEAVEVPVAGDLDLSGERNGSPEAQARTARIQAAQALEIAPGALVVPQDLMARIGRADPTAHTTEDEGAQDGKDQAEGEGAPDAPGGTAKDTDKTPARADGEDYVVGAFRSCLEAEARRDMPAAWFDHALKGVSSSQATTAHERDMSATDDAAPSMAVWDYTVEFADGTAHQFLICYYDVYDALVMLDGESDA